jgi:hypothetical protein
MYEAWFTINVFLGLLQVQEDSGIFLHLEETHQRVDVLSLVVITFHRGSNHTDGSRVRVTVGLLSWPCMLRHKEHTLWTP